MYEFQVEREGERVREERKALVSYHRIGRISFLINIYVINEIFRDVKLLAFY